jgi:hypothetical protein
VGFLNKTHLEQEELELLEVLEQWEELEEETKSLKAMLLDCFSLEELHNLEEWELAQSLAQTQLEPQ